MLETETGGLCRSSRGRSECVVGRVKCHNSTQMTKQLNTDIK